ncbi:hypothetical protein, partial [Thiohalocapsa sp.]|uniref:hypothetical protein n=1 Tax=Thiohalocapsa sp. TaxID=2497641 RepID=UPI0025E70459
MANWLPNGLANWLAHRLARLRGKPPVGRLDAILLADAAGAPMQRVDSAEALPGRGPVPFTHLRAHQTGPELVCRLLLEKKKKQNKQR